MEDAPILLKGCCDEEPKDIREYSLKLNKKNYKIQLSTNNNSKIIFKIEEIDSLKNYYYKSEYSLDDLKAIHKIFRVFDSIEEAYEEVNEIFKNNKAFIESASNEIILHLNISKFSSSKTEDISIEIKKSIFNKEKMDEIFLSELKQIKEKALNDKLVLEEKINLLEQNFNEEKTKNIILIKNLEQSLNEEKQKNILLENKITEIIKEKNELKNIVNEIAENIKIIKAKNEIKNEINSKIIENEEEINLLLDRLKKSKYYKKREPSFKLIYSASKDGDDPLIYCEKCSGKKNTLCVIETKKGCKFGGYTEMEMDFNKRKVLNDPDAFIFSLDEMKIYNPIQNDLLTVDNCKGWGPIYYSAFCVYNENFFSYNNNTIKSKKETNFGGMSKDYEINNGEKFFSIKEIEIFQINY